MGTRASSSLTDKCSLRMAMNAGTMLFTKTA